MVTSRSAPAAATVATEALHDYEAAVARLKAGDWSGFGAKLDALKPLLQSLIQSRAAH